MAIIPLNKNNSERSEDFPNNTTRNGQDWTVDSTEQLLRYASFPEATWLCSQNVQNLQTHKKKPNAETRPL